MNAPRARKRRRAPLLTEFLKLHPGLDASAPINSEEPDFLCLAADGPQVSKSPDFSSPVPVKLPPQALSRYRREFGQRLRANHAGTGMPPVTVTVHLANDTAVVSESRTHRPRNRFVCLRRP